MQQRTIDIMFL